MTEHTPNIIFSRLSTVMYFNLFNCFILLTVIYDISGIGHVHLCLILDPIDVGCGITNGFALHLDRVTHFDDACAWTLGYNRKSCGCFIACNA